MMRVETAPRSVQTVTRQYIEMRSPTSTALDMVQNIPSLSVAASDPAGVKGGSIQTRGLTDLDMALMIDDAPAAQAKYLAENIDSENVESVVVTPGSSNVDLPATTAAAGTLNETTHRPMSHAGGMMDFSYGTNNLSREFIRLESGNIGKSTLRSFFSFSNTHSRSWMGAGINQRKHIDFGLEADWAHDSSARLFLSWNTVDFTIDNYPDATAFYRYKHTGQGFGRSADPQNDDYWKNNNDHWNQIFLTAPLRQGINDRLSLSLTPYFSFGQGWDAKPGGTAGDDVTLKNGLPVPAGTNLTSYFLQMEAIQIGAVAKMTYKFDRHNTFSVGYWYENNKTVQTYPSSVVMPDGAAPSPNWAAYQLSSSYTVPQNAGYELHGLFVHDVAHYLHDKLTIDAGFKFVMSNTWNKSGNSQVSNNTTEPLPQLAISYSIDKNQQVYLNAEGDYRQASPYDLGWLYVSDGIPKNQYSIKEEIGYRYHDDHIIVDASFFNYNVTNRILEKYVGQNSYVPIPGGNQTMRGFDFMISTPSIHGFSPYASVEYLHARQDTNVCTATTSVCTSASQYVTAAGRQAIMAPHVLTNLGITYKYKGFFGNFSLHYTGPQSVSVTGDERIPGYITNTLSIGYHFRDFEFLKSPTFRMNFTNLTGSIVRTSAMGAVYSAQNGVGNAFIVEPRFSMTGTLSTSF